MKKLTILIAAVALVCFSVPAMAVDWNFYGNARMSTFYVSTDYGDFTNPSKTDNEDAELDWSFQGNSRIGANVKAENLKGQFEFGVSSDSSGGGNVSARRLYGEWMFGDAMYLKVGKDYTPVSQFISGQVFDGDLGLLGIGTQYGNREAQVAFGFGGFEISLIQPHTTLIAGMQSSGTSVYIPASGVFVSSQPTATKFKGDVDSVLPKIEAKWGMSFDAWNFNIMGGYQYYSIQDVTSFDNPGTTGDVDVTSYVVGGDMGFNFGPAYVKGSASYGQNIGNAAWGINSGVNGRNGGFDDGGIAAAGSTGWTTYQGGYAVWDGDDGTNDTNTFMGALVAGLKVSDMLSFEAGFGYRYDDPDKADDVQPWAVYVQSVIALAPGVYVIPEIGYYDFDQDSSGANTGSLFYAGGKWQINF
jgi:hypothetical protein